jgi:hypothetical protein
MSVKERWSLLQQAAGYRRLAESRIPYDLNSHAIGARRSRPRVRSAQNFRRGATAAMSRVRPNLAVQGHEQLIRCRYLFMAEAARTDRMDHDFRFALRAQPRRGFPDVTNRDAAMERRALPGPPSRDYPGAIENAAYRLVALGVLDASSAKTATEGILPLAAAI